MDDLAALDLAEMVSLFRDTTTGSTAFRIDDETRRWLAPDLATTTLASTLNLAPETRQEDQAREILLAMMLSPVPFEYPNYDALASATQIRQNIVNAASKTELAFDTSEAAERPADYWEYSEERGFTLIPGKPLIEALRKSTQPEASGKRYDFSCYRATEYVILLAIAETLETRDPALLARLQHQWETRAIKSGAFHETFLIEYGSMTSPLPTKFYVPGDRVWFRNPDDHSSDAEGYEGSWVIYLGGGYFTNFWKHHQPYTLTSKCIEVYHWRHGAYTDAQGDVRIDESIVEERVRATLSNPEEIQTIVTQMMRLREPCGVYVDGGCIDTSREYPRPVCQIPAEFALPDA